MSDIHQTKNKPDKPTIQRTEAEIGLDMSEQSASVVDGAVLQRVAAPPPSLNPNQALQLQRMVGNQAVGQLLGKSQPMVQHKPMSWEPAPPAKSGPLVQPSRKPVFAKFLQRMEEQGIRSQASGVGSREQDSQVQAMPLIQRDGLRVGPANDKYEKEADETADQIMRMPSIRSQESGAGNSQTGDEVLQTSRVVQRHDEDEEQLMPKRLEVVQRAGDGDGFEVGSDFSNQLSSSGSGRPLPKAIQADFGSKMGADLSGVRVHTGSQSADMSSQIQAKAFTHGGDIHFGSGQYQPNTVQGKRLIAHEVTHTVQQGASPITRNVQREETDTQSEDTTVQRKETEQTSGNNQSDTVGVSQDSATSETIQRRIGFEIETGIPITKKVDGMFGDEYHNLFPSTIPEIKSDGGTISVDHIPGDPKHKLHPSERFEDWPIIEYVTDPVDDTLKPSEFEKIAKKWINLLKRIKNAAKSTPPAKQLTGDYYVGLPSPQKYSDDHWDRIAPQATVGIPLDQVAKVIAAFTFGGGASWMAYADDIAKQVSSKADAVMRNVLGQFPPELGDVERAPEMKGLFVMLCHYLMIGGDPRIAHVIYMKNRPSNVFYKTKLSTVRNNLVGSGGYPLQVLNNTTGQNYVKHIIKLITNRTSGSDPVFHGKTHVDPRRTSQSSSVTVDDWLDEVLTGTNDHVFEDMRNQWSDEIKPDANHEMIVELRKVGWFVSHDNYSLEEDDGLLAFLKKVYVAHSLYKTKAI